nr:PAS domain S-box protein [uncultured Caldimonas sp.]
MRPTVALAALLWALCCLGLAAVVLANTVLGHLPLGYGGGGLVREGLAPSAGLVLASLALVLQASGLTRASSFVAALLLAGCAAWGVSGPIALPSVALGLGLMGVALALPPAAGRYAPAAATGAALVTGGASVAGLLGAPVSWLLVDARPMTALLALCLLVVLPAHARRGLRGLDRWAAVLALGGSVVVTQVWVSVAQAREHILSGDAQVAAGQLARLAERAVGESEQALGRLADRIARRGSAAFEEEARAYLRDMPGLRALVLKQGDGRRLVAVREAASGDAALAEMQRIFASDPHPLRAPPSGRSASVHFGARATVIEVDSQGRDASLALSGLFDHPSLFITEMAHIEEWFDFDVVHRGGELLWQHDGAAAALVSRSSVAQAFAGDLQVQVRPSAARVRELMSDVLPLMLCGGLFVAFAAALSRQLAQEGRRRDRELAAQELRHLEARRSLETVQLQMMAAVESMSEGFVLLDERGRIVFANPRAAELTRHELDGLQGRLAVRCFPRAAHREMHRLCVEALRCGCTTEGELLLPGTACWLNVRVHPRGGQLAICFSDHTERRQAELHLHSALEENRLTLDNSLDAICILDGSGNFVRANSAVQAMWGHAPQELVGKPYLDLVAPEDVLKTMMAMSEVMAGYPTRDFENRIVAKDGHLVTTMWSAYWSATLGRVYCVARDLSSRRLKDQLAADQHRILSRIASGMPLLSVLDEVVLMLETQVPGMQGAVALLDHGEQGRVTVAAPGLPAPFARALSEAVDARHGMWRQVVDGKAPVFAVDLQQDPMWSTQRPLVEAGGFRACWCVPVMGQDDEVLGLLMLWHTQPRSPQVHEGELMAVGVQLAGIAAQHWRNKQALSESEQRFRSLFEHNPAAVFALDIAGTIVEMNGSSSALLGYKRNELLGLPFGKVVPGWSREEPSETALHGGKPASSTHEVLACHSSGALRELSVTVVPTYVGERPVGYYAVAYDVTGAKQNLRRLRLHAQVIAGTHDAIALVDLEGRVVDWNKGATRLFGVPADRAVGRSLASVVNGDDRNRLLAAISSVARERVQGSEVELATAAEGSALRHMVLTLSYLGDLDDVDPLIVIYGLDITQRKAAENAIRESHAFFRLSSEMFCTADREGRLRQVNPAFVSTLGHDESALLSTPFLDFVHPDDQAATALAFETLRRDGAVRAFVNRLRHCDGRHRWIEWTGSIDPAGTVYAVARDVTERRAAEAAFDRLLHDLKSTNRELQDFAFVASHDLQEPLRKVLAFSDRLRVRHADALAGEGIDYLDRLDNAARRMQRLITDLLSYSRVSTRQRTFERVDLAQVVQAVLSDLESSIERSGAVIEVGELGEIDADAGQLEHLLQNLLSNAIKFSRPGQPPHIRLHAHAVKLTPPGGSQPQPHLALHVEDDGIGFEQQHAERIFMPFQRLHGRDRYEGTGIGLAIVRKIAERHRAGLEVTSAPGMGARFVLTFPVLQPRDGTPAPATQDSVIAAHTS